MTSNPERDRRFRLDLPLPRRLGRLAGALLVLAVLALPVRLAGQETEGPLSPAGRLRIDVAPSFHAWSARFGTDGREPLGRELTSETGARVFPTLDRLAAALAAFTGEAAYVPALGATSAEVAHSRTRLSLGADLGVTDWLTVGVTVPVVQSRTEVAFDLAADPETTNVGVSPAISRPLDVIDFTAELDAVARAAASHAADVCASAPGSAACTDATGIADEGRRLHEGFLASYAASPFFPLAGSAVALGLRARVDAFRQGIAALGLAPLARDPLFAEAAADAAQLQALLSDGAVGLGTGELATRAGAWALGDVELRAAVRLLDGERPGAAGAPPRLSYQVGAAFLVRLGTGTRDDPDLPLDLGSGDGQTDLEGRAFSNVRSGRFGMWTDVRYGVQRPRSVIRRVGPAGQVLVAAINRTEVEWSPGSYLQVEVAPRYHFTPELAFTAGYRLHHKAGDGFVRISPAPALGDLAPLPSPVVHTDVALLEAGTEERLHEIGAGLVLSTLEAWRAGRTGRPFEARFAVRWAASGAGRQVPAGVRATAGVRLFWSLWGG